MNVAKPVELSHIGMLLKVLTCIYKEDFPIAGLLFIFIENYYCSRSASVVKKLLGKDNHSFYKIGIEYGGAYAFLLCPPAKAPVIDDHIFVNIH